MSRENGSFNLWRVMSNKALLSPAVPPLPPKAKIGNSRTRQYVCNSRAHSPRPGSAQAKIAVYLEDDAGQVGSLADQLAKLNGGFLVFIHLGMCSK